MHRLFLRLAPLLAAAAAAGADLAEARGTGLRVPRGFMAERVADAALAGEIHAFTLDRFGRMVVTGPGSLRTLGDQNLDRRADTATPFAPVRTAGWGLAAAGPDLWWTGDEGLWRFRDADGDGRADGPGEKVLAITTGPGAAHVLALGPDGFLHLGAGFATAFAHATHAGDPASPFARFEAGAVLRLTGTERAEAWAVGLRNPRGLAFSAEGPLLAWDAEDPREAFLPWALPTRLIEAPAGLRQGWLRADESGSWALPERQPDSTEALARAAGAVPGGLAVYRHAVLPAAWWGRVLAADTANGRVLAFRLAPGAGGWTAQADVFVEGVAGTFFPLGIEVAPDGAVLIASGGKGPGAGIFRVAPLRPAHDVLAARAQLAAERPIEGVLRAPQPLSAWSLEAWRPVAEALGGGAFLEAARDARRPAEERIRAVEVATQLFGGLDETTTAALLRDPRPELRARAAWSLGVTGPPFLGRALAGLLADAAPAVRREAAGVLLHRRRELPPAAVAEGLAGLLGDSDFRVRRIAVTLGDRLDEAAWGGLWASRSRQPLPAQLTLGFASLRRRGGPGLHPDLIELGLQALPRVHTAEDRLLAVLLVQAALGHWRLDEPSRRALAPFEPAAGDEAAQRFAPRIQAAVRPLLRSGETPLDLEAVRLLAMVRDPDPGTLQFVVGRLGLQTAPAVDFHHLAVLARLPAERPAGVTFRVADALLRLHRRLGPGEPRPGRRWPEALAEVAAVLAARDPALGPALAAHPRLLEAAHVPLAAALPPAARAEAGRRFAALLPTQPRFPWTPELVAVLAAAPDTGARALLRGRAGDPALRPAVVAALAERPAEADREALLEALDDPRARDAALAGLAKLPPETRAGGVGRMLAALRGALREPGARAFREGLAAEVGRARGDGFTVTEATEDPAALAALYAPLFAWFAEQFPEEARRLPAPPRS